MLDPSVIGSDDWIAMELATELGAGFPRLAKLKKYRDGDAPVPEDATPAMRAAYVQMVQRGRLNVCDIIVSSKTNRQEPVGFRTAAVGDDLGDELAWQNWRRSRMQVNAGDLFDDKGHYGTAFTVVAGPDKGAPEFAEQALGPTFMPRNSWTTATRQMANAPWLTEDAVVVNFDPLTGADIINVFRRGYVRTAFRPGKNGRSSIPSDGTVWKPGSGWDWAGAPVPYGFTDENVVVRFDAPDGVGFYEKHLDTIDRINDLIKQRSIIVAMQAFRQRAIKGDLPRQYPADHELAGQDIDYNEIFKAGPAALWLLPSDADIWESATTDITPILSAAKDDLKNLAAVTATALYMLAPDAAAGSAEGASLARESLVFSVKNLNKRDAEGFATMHAIGFASMGDTVRSDASSIETIWANVDALSVLEAGQAASAAKAGGATQRWIDEHALGMTPAEQKQARQDRQDEAFDAQLAATPTPQQQQQQPAGDIADQETDDGSTIVDEPAAA